MLQWRNWHTRQIQTLFSPGSTPGWSTIFEINSGGDFVNNISAVAIGMLIAAHREGDEEKFRAYVDAHCVGINTDGYSVIHWVPVKSIGKTVFYNPTDAARYAAAMSDYYDKHYAFGGTPIRRTQWEHFLEKD